MKTYRLRKWYPGLSKGWTGNSWETFLKPIGRREWQLYFGDTKTKSLYSKDWVEEHCENNPEFWEEVGEPTEETDPLSAEALRMVAEKATEVSGTRIEYSGTDGVGCYLFTVEGDLPYKYPMKFSASKLAMYLVKDVMVYSNRSIRDTAEETRAQIDYKECAEIAKHLTNHSVTYNGTTSDGEVYFSVGSLSNVVCTVDDSKAEVIKVLVDSANDHPLKDEPEINYAGIYDFTEKNFPEIDPVRENRLGAFLNLNRDEIMEMLKPDLSPIKKKEETNPLHDYDERMMPGFDSKKPPLGVCPEWLHKERRRDALNDAIRRYFEAGTDIPYEWIQEREKLDYWLREHEGGIV